MKEPDHHSPCSVRVHGQVIVSHEPLRIGDIRPRRGRFQPEQDLQLEDFDHRVGVADPSLFRSYVACRDLIHGVLADAPVTGEYDLGADNWDDFLPHGIATTIVATVRRDVEDGCGVVPVYAFDVELILSVRLIHSEPKALLLACKEADAEVASHGELGERCGICMFDEEGTNDGETVRLPCSHVFHSRCIEPWFHRVSTCPTCRSDAMDCFGFVTLSRSTGCSYTT
ncbi:hypothetical protein ACQJBY_025072 [Aegilops geniculata]